MSFICVISKSKYRILDLAIMSFFADIEAAFENLKTEAENCDAPLFGLFVAYFKLQWIERVFIPHTF